MLALPSIWTQGPKNPSLKAHTTAVGSLRRLRTL
jgi:hypothetical protein